MVVLVLDLKNSTIKEEEYTGEQRGLPLALSLHSMWGEDSLVLASLDYSSSPEPLRAWPIVYHSVITGKTEVSVLSTSHGYSLYRMDIAAVVITGHADKLKYISLTPSKKEILPIENMRAQSSRSFESVVLSLNEISLSTGVAADKGVWFGSLQSNGRNVYGLGLGHAFFLHNLKGIVFTLFSDYPESESIKIKKNSFNQKIKKYGEYAVVPTSLKLGWAPINNYSDRFDPRVYNLDGRSMQEKWGNYPDGCTGCPLSCQRRTRSEDSLPSWRELFFLGPNIGFFNAENIQKIYSKAIELGLEIPTLGAMISYIFSLPSNERAPYMLKEHTVDAVLSFIERIATGSLLSKGLVSLSGAVQGYDHRPVSYDLRGAYAEALLVSQGLDLILPATLFFPKKKVSVECAAIFALYETIYTLALTEKGYPYSFYAWEYWDKLPQIAFCIPSVARFYLKRFKAYGFTSEDLLPVGLEALERMALEWHPIPRCFIDNSVSSFDSETVPLKKLQDYYDEEKLKLLIALKSKREKSAIESSKNSANVGPEEERG